MSAMEPTIVNFNTSQPKKRIYFSEKKNQNDVNGFWEFSFEDEIFHCSNSLREILEVPCGIAVTKEFVRNIVSEKDFKKLEKSIDIVTKSNQIISEEFALILPKQKYRFILSSFQGVFDINGKLRRIIGFTQDVTSSRQFFEKITAIDEEVNIFLSEEAVMFRKAVEIFNWKQDLLSKDSSLSWKHGALTLINTSLMQGSGIGSLITSLGSLFRKSKEEGNNVIIPKNIFNFVLENYFSARKLASSLSEAQKIFEETFELENSIVVENFRESLQELSESLDPMKSIKSQSIIFSENEALKRYKFLCNLEKMKIAFKEIFINAMKYSPENARIHILSFIQDHQLIIKTINPLISEMEIDDTDQIRVFEPFFRLDKVVDERFEMEDYSLGLGLAVVKRLIEKQNGKIYFNIVKVNAFNHTQAENEACITVIFPLAYC